MADQPSTAARPKPDRQTRQARKYGFACANCRKRKARCNGQLPSCARCVANGETCYFNKVPSVAYSLALQSRVNACETLIERLRGANDAERLRMLEEQFTSDTNGAHQRPVNSQEQRENSPQSEATSENDLTELLNETSVDEDGRICFYGTTSLFHLQPDQSVLSGQQAGEVSEASVVMTDDAVSGDRIPQWRNSLAFDTPSPALSTSVQTDLGTFLNTDVDSELCNELLETYWCWPHHLHLVLCRKIFMHDLVTSGPNVTPFLLNAVLAQAARYSDRPEASKLGQHFAQKVLDSLAAEVHKGSSIPTIQGFLIFSARECACGRTSQGWLYSGMAFRMMRDMGIHIHPSKLSHLVGQFSRFELALRQQIFWSCYTWDKTMSLCLGRPPTIHDIMSVPTNEMFLDGEEAEEETWRPKFATISALEVGVLQKSKSNSRFVAYCHLCMIIDDILATLYSKPNSAQHNLHGYLDRAIEKLEHWVHGLPSHLYVREESRSVSCPPLHILLLNLLYHATIILLCRPYRSKQDRARKMATTAAEMIDRLFMLHVRRFGFRVITYLESYTMFVASTINILDMKEGIDEEGASARLALSLEIFRNATSTPSNARCVEIIEQLIRKNERSKDDLPNNQTQNWTQATPKQNKDNLPSMPLAPTLPLPPQPWAPFNLSPMGPPQRVDDFTFFNTADIDLQPNYERDNLHDGDVSASVLPIQPSSTVETPLRWLADNVGTNARPELWMMMNMDFGKDFDAQDVSGIDDTGRRE
ncbi:hypothetical protein MMC08_008875 [Hypocenomyce scalaris]|nr:hypothetical protein [Hypocenomyce scalaris]